MTPSKRSPSQPKLRITKLLPASPQVVFAAWLDPEGIKDWLCPGSVTTIVEELDPRVSGKFKIIMKDGNVDYVQSGEYLEIDPPRRLVFTWISGLTNNEPSQVTIQLRRKGDKTELVLTHEKLPTEESADKHKGGWGSVMEKLTLRFEN